MCMLCDAFNECAIHTIALGIRASGREMFPNGALLEDAALSELVAFGRFGLSLSCLLR